jgi:hypothetical protein
MCDSACEEQYRRCAALQQQAWQGTTSLNAGRKDSIVRAVLSLFRDVEGITDVIARSCPLMGSDETMAIPEVASTDVLDAVDVAQCFPFGRKSTKPH